VAPTKTTSTLALLVTRIATDDENDAAAAYDLTIFANSLDAGSDFHGSLALGKGKVYQYKGDEPIGSRPSERKISLFGPIYAIG
jgi:hypothetical protein